MPCKLVIENPDLKRVLGRSPSENVVFDTFQDYMTAIPAGQEMLVSESDGHFIAKFRQLSYNDGAIKVLYDSEYGRGSAPIKDILGWATTELLKNNLDELNPLAKARLVPPVAAPLVPEDGVETIDGAGNSVTSEAAEYDEDNSKIKLEQFEATTGQDVKSDFLGTLDPRDSTLSKMALKNMIAEAPYKFKYFIVPDRAEFFNEAGIEPTGEVLLVVHAAAYQMAFDEKGSALNNEELLEVAVRMRGEEIAAEGEIYTLPLEGTTGQEDDQFFSRNHEERVAIYAEKNGITEEEADYHYRQGQAHMWEMRTRSHDLPVPVSIRPSLGFYFSKPLSVSSFIDKHQLTQVSFGINLKKSGVVGRVYIKGTMDGKQVEMLTVPVSILEKYELPFIQGIAGAILTGQATREEISFFASLLGTNRKKKGPYVKLTADTASLFSDGVQITTLEGFMDALSDNNWPAVTNKITGSESVTTQTIWKNGEFVLVSPIEFVQEHVTTDGDFWTHKGKAVPYAANRYFYLDEIDGDTIQFYGEDSLQARANAVNRLFRDKQEYLRIAESDAPEDQEIKLAYPQFFNERFRNSRSYARLLAGLKVDPSPVIGEFGFRAPVGGLYFTTPAEVRAASTPYEEFAAVKIAELNQKGIYDLEALGINSDLTLEDWVLLHEANNVVAFDERMLIFGTLPEDVSGIKPNRLPSELGPAVGFSAVFSGDNRASVELRSAKTDEPRMSLDTYRTYMRLMNKWTPELENAFQNEMNFFTDGEISGETFANEYVELGYNGPANVTANGEYELLNTPPTKWRLVIPSRSETDAALNRKMLEEKVSVGSPSGDTLYLNNFYLPVPSVPITEQVVSNLRETNTPLPKTELANYAVEVLGENFAKSLLSYEKNLTFDDVNAFSNFIGQDFPITEIKTQKDFAISANSAPLIASGAKTITLRKRTDQTVGRVNTAGLVQIEGKIFQIAELGEMGFDKAREMTGMSANEFVQAFFGDEFMTVDGIFDQGVKAFFEGSGTRRVFTIKEVVKPYNTNTDKRGPAKKKKSVSKTQAISCKKIR